MRMGRTSQPFQVAQGTLARRQDDPGSRPAQQEDNAGGEQSHANSAQDQPWCRGFGRTGRVRKSLRFHLAPNAASLARWWTNDLDQLILPAVCRAVAEAQQDPW